MAGLFERLVGDEAKKIGSELQSRLVEVETAIHKRLDKIEKKIDTLIQLQQQQNGRK